MIVSSIKKYDKEISVAGIIVNKGRFMFYDLEFDILSGLMDLLNGRSEFE